MVLGMRTAALCLVGVLLPSSLLVIGAANLGDMAQQTAGAGRPARGQCRGRRPVARGALPAGLDDGHRRGGRLRARNRRLPAVVHVAHAAVACRVSLRRGGGPAPRRWIGLVALAIVSMFNCRGPPIGTGFARATPVERPNRRPVVAAARRLGCAGGVAPRRRQPPRVETANGRLATGRRLTERYP